MTEGRCDDALEWAGIDPEPADEPSLSEVLLDEAAPLPRQHGIWKGIPGGWLCTCGCGDVLDEQLRPVRMRRAS